MIKLDKVDRKLLHTLEQDARQPHTKIAKQLHTSQQVISYRMQSLEKKGIIGGHHTLINFTKLGYTSYRTMIRFSNVTKEKHKEIILHLLQHPNVLWVVDCGGRWDLLFNFIARDIIHYNELLKEFRNKFPEQVQNYDVLTTVELIFFGRDYFINKRAIKKHPYYGRDASRAELDRNDILILKELAENARVPLVEIANKLGMSANTIMLRMKNMKHNGIIQGYRPLIHIDDTEWAEYKALIKFHNVTEEAERKLLGYLESKTNVVFVLKLVGAWDFEVEFAAKNQEEMLKLTRDIRDRFRDIIKEFEIIPLYHEYRYNYFPGDLIQGTS